MQKRIKIQSFGDIITNSSSEVYTIYNRTGVNAILEAVKNLVKAINPDINVDDHITIDLIPNDREMYDSLNDDSTPFNQFYDKKFNEWCLDKSNEEILLGFPEWLESFEDEYCTDDDGIPLWDIEIKALTDLGETIKKSIYYILNAFDHEEVYT